MPWARGRQQIPESPGFPGLGLGFEIHFENLGFGIQFQNLGFEIGIRDLFSEYGIWDWDLGFGFWTNPRKSRKERFFLFLYEIIRIIL